MLYVAYTSGTNTRTPRRSDSTDTASFWAWQPTDDPEDEQAEEETEREAFPRPPKRIGRPRRTTSEIWKPPLNRHSCGPRRGGSSPNRAGLFEPYFSRKLAMHYRNGREAKNGDLIVMLNDDGSPGALGVLHSAVPGNDYCNGYIAPVQSPTQYACLCDCLHVDDVAAMVKEKGLDKRPEGK